MDTEYFVALIAFDKTDDYTDDYLRKFIPLLLPLHKWNLDKNMQRCKWSKLNLIHFATVFIKDSDKNIQIAILLMREYGLGYKVNLTIKYYGYSIIKFYIR